MSKRGGSMMISLSLLSMLAGAKVDARGDVASRDTRIDAPISPLQTWAPMHRPAVRIFVNADSKAPETGPDSRLRAADFSQISKVLGSHSTIPHSRLSLSLFNNTRGSRVFRQAAQCLITSTGDSGSGSLRSCLENAEAGGTITFDPRHFPSDTPTRVVILSKLPDILVDDLTIDASEAGVVLDGSRIVVENTSQIVRGIALRVSGAQNVAIRGLQIEGFAVGIVLVNGATGCTIGGDRSLGAGPVGQGNRIAQISYYGVSISSSGTTGNMVQGNLIGTDLSGEESNLTDSNQIGLIIGNSGSGNTIGGPNPGQGNIIAGNRVVEVAMIDPGTIENRVIGNTIGLSESQEHLLARRDGLWLSLQVRENWVGGMGEREGNVIAGLQNGILIESEKTGDNRIVGNAIGAARGAVAGLDPAPSVGILVNDGAGDNVIGGSTAEERNVIAGNSLTQVVLEGELTSRNRIEGNYIGVSASGIDPLGGQIGIDIGGASDNSIGGEGTTLGNVISGNNLGIQVSDLAFGNHISANRIGTTADGLTVLSNQVGILLAGVRDNIVGGPSAESGNVISGNSLAGVQVGGGSMGNQIDGNLIGVDVTGLAPLPNVGAGIAFVTRAEANIVGGTARNIISGNGFGVLFQNEARENIVQGNYIGIGVDGRTAIGNTGGGVVLLPATRSNVIGGTEAGSGNVISGNGAMGVAIQGDGSELNKVRGNIIGLDAEGRVPVGNASHGILMNAGASGNIVGGSVRGAGNLIAGNMRNGIRLQDLTTNDNWIESNQIGVVTGEGACIGNKINGINLLRLGPNTIGTANNIVCNDADGIAILFDAEGDTAGALGKRITKNAIWRNDGDAIVCFALDQNGQIDPKIGCAVPAPTLTAFDSGTRRVTGNACAHCSLEVFETDEPMPGSRNFLGSGVAAADGSFTVNLRTLPRMRFVSATATDETTATTSLYSVVLDLDRESSVFLPKLGND